VLLNLAPDHLDWHGSYEAYVAAKGKVYARQGSGDTHVGNKDDEQAAALSSAAPCRKVWFGTGSPAEGEVGYEVGRLVARFGSDSDLGTIDPTRAGALQDAAAAAAASLVFGASPAAVAQGLATFEPRRHRGEVVATVDGIRFIDNSKATNVHAAIASIETVEGAVLIAGGRAKGVDLSPLRSKADRLVAVVAIGESAQELIRVFQGSIPIQLAGSIEEAVRAAFQISPAGGTVLLAPACASWDQFRDYEERGERFAAAAAALSKETVARG
jgi:UDP-N-acetylmuramoylalanine--D-glutamate ligase